MQIKDKAMQKLSGLEAEELAMLKGGGSDEQ